MRGHDRQGERRSVLLFAISLKGGNSHIKKVTLRVNYGERVGEVFQRANGDDKIS